VITGYKWELYNVMEDPTQNNDLAAKMPDKLKQMQNIFYLEAAKYNVLPLDNTTLARWNAPKPSLTAGRTSSATRARWPTCPAARRRSILNKSYTITAEVTIPAGGAEGMIVTQGGRFGGYGLFLSKGELGVGRGKVVFLYNLLDLKRTTGKGLNWLPASTPSSSTSSPMVRAWARAGPVCSTWTARKWPGIRWNTPPITFPRTRPSTSARTRARRVAMIEYRYDRRSSSPARSTS
jgi:hypothetical protein